MFLCSLPAHKDAFAAPQYVTREKWRSVSSAGGHIVLLLIALGLLHLSLGMKGLCGLCSQVRKSQVRQQVVRGGAGVWGWRGSSPLSTRASWALRDTCLGFQQKSSCCHHGIKENQTKTKTLLAGGVRGNRGSGWIFGDKRLYALILTLR